MKLLITGAAGFVGSHFARVASDAGLFVVALDDLSTSPRWPQLPDAITRVRGDVGDRALVTKLLLEHEIDAIVHFAGRICVAESMHDPALYFEQNLARTCTLLDVATSLRRPPPAFVLSSSAAVYGTSAPREVPISPYGASKLACEVALASYGHARGVSWAALRYFNASGAHPDGSLREAHDPETHLIPLAIDAALGIRPPLIVYGDDHPTRDGTCVRDYVHVMDLADAHLAALKVLAGGTSVGTADLGSGHGATVLEVLAEVDLAVGCLVPHVGGGRRAGDPSELVVPRAEGTRVLTWQPRRELREIVTDAVRSRRM